MYVRACMRVCVDASMPACKCLLAMHKHLPQPTVGAEFPIPYNFHYQYKYELMNLKTFNLLVFYYFIKKFKITCSHCFLINNTDKNRLIIKNIKKWTFIYKISKIKFSSFELLQQMRYNKTPHCSAAIPFPTALQPGVGLGLLQEFSPSFPV